jgi:BCCT family betaine/carnitine transporter
MKERKIDRVLFFAAAGIVLAACIPLGLMPERAGPVIEDLYNWIASNLGIFYQWFGIGTILYLIWLSLGRYGHIRLGGDGDKPDFSTFSWAGMLFCAGTGASLLVWAGVEWAYYIDAPPYGAEPRSAEAIAWASSYGPFHWGVTAWCFYALPTIAIAYPFYVKKVPHLRASTALHSILGPKGENSPVGRAVDLAIMIALIGGAGTSLGVIAPTIAASVAEILGLQTSFTLQLSVMLFCIGLFALSVYLGLEKGIKRLSDTNVYLALGLMAYILVVGPTLFILKASTDTIGFMLGNFVRMMSWTDPIDQSGFGTLGCWVFYFIMGNYSLSLELNGQLSVTQELAAHGMYETVARIIGTLPFGTLTLSLFALVSVISVATTYDSASYTLASTATSELKVSENPARWNRLVWAGVLGMLPIFMMLVGGLPIIRSGVLIASLPLLIVGVAMAVALTKSLRQHDVSPGT